MYKEILFGDSYITDNNECKCWTCRKSIKTGELRINIGFTDIGNGIDLCELCLNEMPIQLNLVKARINN